MRAGFLLTERSLQTNVNLLSYSKVLMLSLLCLFWIQTGGKIRKQINFLLKFLVILGLTDVELFRWWLSNFFAGVIIVMRKNVINSVH